MSDAKDETVNQEMVSDDKMSMPREDGGVMKMVGWNLNILTRNRQE